MKKRIALSAVAALAGGLLVAAPASAAAAAVTSVTLTSGTSYLKGVSDTKFGGSEIAGTAIEFGFTGTDASGGDAAATGKLTLTHPVDGLDEFKKTAGSSGTAAVAVDGTTNKPVASAATVTIGNLDTTASTTTSSVFPLTAITPATAKIKIWFGDDAIDAGTYTAKVEAGGFSKTWSWTVVDVTAVDDAGYFVAQQNNTLGSTVVAGANNSAFVDGLLPNALLKVSGSTYPANYVSTNAALVPSTDTIEAGLAAVGDVTTPFGHDFTDATPDTAALANVKVLAAAAGTVTLKAYPATSVGQYSDLAMLSLSFSVAAAADNVYSFSRVTGGGTGATTTVAATAAAAGPTLTVTQYNAAGAALTGGYTKGVEFALAGDTGSFDSGLLTTRTTTKTVLAGTSATQAVTVYPTGTAGTATVTVKVDGVLVHTETFVFTGTVATVTATQALKVVAANDSIGAAKTDDDHAVAVSVKDANGKAIEGATIAVTSSNAQVIATTGTGSWSSTTKVYNFQVDGAVSGKSGETATLTFSVLNSAGVAVKSEAITFAIGGDVKTVTMALDKATYAPGEKATLTVTAKDAAGNAAASNDVSSVVSNLASQGLTNTITVDDGSATLTVYAPVTAGTWTISGKDANGVAVSASAAVAVPADANITAINAKVASTEATVAALQVTVASIIKSLKVQWWLLKKIAVKVGIKLG